MIATEPRPKQSRPRPWPRYTQDQHNQVMALHREGKTMREIEEQSAVPRATACAWINKLGTKDLRNTVNQSVAHVVREAVNNAKSIASQQVEQFIANQLEVGTIFVDKAKSIAKGKWNRKSAGNLLSAANTAKIGVSIARQALGLDQEGAGTQSIRIQNMTVVSRSSEALAELEPVQEAEIVMTPVMTEPVQDPPKP